MHYQSYVHSTRATVVCDHASAWLYTSSYIHDRNVHNYPWYSCTPLSSQIFEWCHFASMLGLLSSSLPDGSSSSVSSGVQRKMTTCTSSTVYAQLISRYKYLCTEYDKALAQAEVRRKKTFPSREMWQPPLPISLNDIQLLHGPKDILIHKTL